MRLKILTLLCTTGFCTAFLPQQEQDTFWDEEIEENCINDKQVDRQWRDLGTETNQDLEDRSLAVDSSFQPRLLDRGVDLGIVYDFLTSDTTAVGFVTGVIGEFVSKTVGWLVIHFIWTSARGATTGAELDIPALWEFVVNPTGNVINIAISSGYVLMNLITWTALGAIGPSGPAIEAITRSDEEFSEFRSLEKSLNSTEMMSTLDALFSVQGVARTTSINFFVALGYVGFWGIMTLLPEQAAPNRVKREESEEEQLILNQQLLDDSIAFFDSL